MSSTLEDFRLDLSDDNDIEYAIINKAVSMMISVIIEELPGRVARQKIVNRFAELVRNDREKAEKMVLSVVEDMDKVQEFLNESAKARRARSMDRSLKSMNSLIKTLTAMAN